MKKQLYILLFLLSKSIFAQEKLAEIPLKLRNNATVFEIVYEKTNNVSLFFADKSILKVLRSNDKFVAFDSIIAKNPGDDNFSMIGYDTDNPKKPTVFWASGNRKEFLIQNFDFDNHKVNEQKQKLILGDEILFQEFVIKGKLHLLTSVQNSSDINMYIFDVNGKLEIKNITLNHIKFFKDNFTSATFNEVINYDLRPFESNTFQRINQESPASLKLSAKKRKAYLQNDKLILSTDINSDHTQLITIDLDNYTVTGKTFKQPTILNKTNYHYSSNSFLIDDKLFQFKATANEMDLSIKNMNNELIKNYHVADKQEINFKNSDLILMDGNKNGSRVLEKSSQFLRKVNDLNAGISCYKTNDNYLVTIGSVSIENNNQYVATAMMFGVVGVLISIALSESTLDSFNSYSNRKVIYTNCLFNTDGNHVSGEVKPLAFDKIKKFLDENNKITSKALFKMNDNYYLGTNDKLTSSFVLRKFTD